MKVQDVKILIGNEDYISEGQLRFHSERGKVEMVWTCDYDGHSPPPPPKQQEKRKERFVHVLKQDTQRVDVTEKTAKDRVRWWQVIYCGDA